MANKKKPWLDPNSHALAFLGNTSRWYKKAEKPLEPVADAKTRIPGNEAVTVIDNPEVIETKTRDALVPYADANRLPDVPGAPKIPKAVFSPPIDLAEFEKTIRQMATTLDFELPEGWLDRWFLRSRNYRIEEKTERVRLLSELQTAFAELIRRQCDVAEEVRRHNQIRFQQVFDALDAWGTAAEKQLRIFLASERAKDGRAIEIERMKVEIEKHRAEVRGIQRGQNVADAEAKKQIAKSEYDAKHPEPLPPPPCEPKYSDEDIVRLKAFKRSKAELDIAQDAANLQSEFESQKSADGVARILKVFGNAYLDRYTKLRRIQELIDQYHVDETILPLGIKELLNEEEDYDADQE